MTIDKRRRAPGTLPAFTPVPRHFNRHDGWTAERQRGFIEALAETGSVKAAAHAVNMTPEGAYLLRRHPQAGEFRRAWEAALALGVERLEDVAMDRALHGQQVPVYSYGKLIGTRTVYNDRLLMFLLRNRAPTRFAADGRVTARRASLNDPLMAGRLARLKKQWRKEWEEECEAKAARDGEALVQSINAKLGGMRDRLFDGMTSRARALHDEWGDCYTGVMTDNAPELAEIHDRSPVILDPGEWDTWLTAPLADLARFDRPFPAARMVVEATGELWRG